MITRSHQGDAEQGERTPRGGAAPSVTHITEARRAASLPLERQLEEVQELLDRGLPSVADARLRQLIAQARREPAVLARARYLLSTALQTMGRNRDALEAVEMYEPADSG